ncbi:MAG: imidazole glycerol phosphate synthase subunit HisH [Proteobacteria bacterium]|nr:imidazole glycerol phosphate synthase subunit HisH [Pseudomonadota bacterium]MBU1715934.1 imidazole glycerol phosphate synthase subunit HisH [Pseudomonadota bacterium]
MIAIIDYKAGNLTSVARAVSHLGHEVQVTDDPELIRAADRVIFPGVGAAGQAMADMQRLGLDQVLKEAFAAGKPILGICLGTQIIFTASQENNNTKCLGILPGTVKRFPEPLFDGEARLKIPHMGWNRVNFVGSHPVFAGLNGEHEFYFVHSYYPEVSETAREIIAGTTNYGITFTSAVARDNLVAVQFHPEKSGAAGLIILENFCNWRPSC